MDKSIIEIFQLRDTFDAAVLCDSWEAFCKIWTLVTENLKLKWEEGFVYPTMTVWDKFGSYTCCTNKLEVKDLKWCEDHGYKIYTLEE